MINMNNGYKTITLTNEANAIISISQVEASTPGSQAGAISALFTLGSEHSTSYGKMARLFCLAILMQILVIVGLLVPRMYTLATGTVITLRTSPVDPSDLFRGDYVSLKYDRISQLTVNRHLEHGQEIYLVIKKQAGQAIPVTVSNIKPHLGPNELAIKGSVQNEYPHGTYHLKYGIEKYFVPEGTGRRLEKTKHLNVSLAIDSFGNAAIKNVREETAGKNQDKD